MKPVKLQDTSPPGLTPDMEPVTSQIPAPTPASTFQMSPVETIRSSRARCLPKVTETVRRRWIVSLD